MRDKSHYKEYFNCALVLKGKVKYLEEIKQHIIDNYVNTRLVNLIKPMYAKDDFSIVNELEYWEFMGSKREKAEKHLDESDTFFFAFVLRGEVKYIEKIRDYIAEFKSVEVVTLNYDKERLFIVNKSRWERYKSTKEEGL